MPQLFTNYKAMTLKEQTIVPISLYLRAKTDYLNLFAHTPHSKLEAINRFAGLARSPIHICKGPTIWNASRQLKNFFAI